MSDDFVIRVLPLNPKHTDSKNARLTEIHAAGVHTIRAQLRHVRGELFRSGTLSQRMNATGLPTTLPARYAAELSTSTMSMVHGWLTNVKKTSLDTLRGTSLNRPESKDFYRLTYRLVSFGYGFGPHREVDPKITNNINVTLDDVDTAYGLCRRIVRNSVSRIAFPTLSPSASITLGGKVVEVDTSANTSFDGIVTFMGTERGKPIHVPVNLPKRTMEALVGGGKIINCVQLSPTKSGRVRLRVVGHRRVTHGLLNPDVTVGIDVGAVSPVTTNFGDMLGRGMWERVQHYDRVMQRAMRGVRPRNGHKHWNDSAAYRNAVRRLRGYVRNEINRALNHVMELHAPSEIVVEHLERAFNVEGRHTSRRMKRLLRSVGRQVFQDKLTALTEDTGVRVVEVNAAYTSKGCHCGNVDDKNRVSQSVFRCTRCGRKRNADVHASTMIAGRRSVSGLSRVRGESSFLGGRERALAHQRASTLLWCRERRTQPESSAGAGRELAPVALKDSRRAAACVSYNSLCVTVARAD